MQRPNINTNIDNIQPNGEWAEIPVAKHGQDYPVIGQFLRPEDQEWHLLCVEGFGEYAVKARTIDAAWLKLSYHAQDPTRDDVVGPGTKPDFNPEEQLDIFLSAVTLPPGESRANNRVYRGQSIAMRSLVEFNPSPVKRYPEFAHLFMKMSRGGEVVSWDDYIGKPKPYPKVA